MLVYDSNYLMIYIDTYLKYTDEGELFWVNVQAVCPVQMLLKA